MYAQAEPFHQRALSIHEVALGSHHPDVAASLNSLGNVYNNEGLYDRAEPLLQRAVAIREATFGGRHPLVADSLLNLSSVYTNEGLYDRAEPLLQRAIAIYEAALGSAHSDVADSLLNLSNVYTHQGLYGRAEPLLQRSLSIQEAALGITHPAVSMSLNNLADLYMLQGLYEKAEPLFQRTLSIYEAASSPNLPDTAISLNNLADLYMEQGLYEKAEPLLQRALTIREAVLGHNHPDIAISLNSLANLYQRQGLSEKARLFLLRALAIREASLGPHHPDVAVSLNTLARLDLAQHHLAEALPLLTRAFSISERRLRQEALGFSAARLANFLQYLRQNELDLYALARAYPQDVRARQLALSAALLLKGRSLEETSNISRALWQQLGANDRATLERLRGLRTQLVALSFSGPGTLAPEAYQRRLQAVAAEGDALEADLARLSAPLRARTTLPPAEEIVERVAASLPKDAALVEFVAYEGTRTQFQAPRGTPPPRTPESLRYMALVLFPDASSQSVDLGPAEAIDHAALRLRDLLADRTDSFQAPSRELYQRVFQPLLPLLGSTRRLLVSPEGQLSLVPFAALHDGHGFLVDSFDFIYLNSGRDLLPRPAQASASSVVVLADPDFSAPAPATPSAFSDTGRAPSRSAALERFFSTARGDLSASAWEALPGTRQEALEIRRLLPQAQLFVGAQATKECLLHLPTPGILHLATHGFFLDDASAPVSADSRAVGHFGALADTPLAVHGQEPLLRSGIVLAGASAQTSTAAPASGSRLDASLATALELAGLNLWGTQLVVLSACDTGRGDVRPGQGIYGLRRALVEAGAETVVMSLWKVRDDSTRQLMEAYYRNLLADQGRASALNEAMRSLRASRPHPHDWAPFIAVGSDAPLSIMAPPTRPPPPAGSVDGAHLD